MERCLISYLLCGNLQNNFGPHKAFEKSGLGGCEIEDCYKGGLGCFSSYVSSDA
jgi:hypothetical protein